MTKNNCIYIVRGLLKKGVHLLINQDIIIKKYKDYCKTFIDDEYIRWF